MKQNRSKKIILTILIAVFVLFVINSTDIFAAINNTYSGADNVTDTALEDAFEGSSILGLLARLIYAVGRFLEWILGLIFQMLTGQTDFPWADKIVFNSVALLDVNFINPAAKSFVGNTSVSEVLKNIYSTILSLSVAFFGITVLITAIKLVISAVASEKAKYKQAIVDWLVGFLMLFCMHYFISFTFYLNEELVKVASGIVTKQLNNAEEQAKPIVQVNAAKISEELVSNIESKLQGTGADVSILKNNMNVVQTWANLPSGDGTKGIHEYVQKKQVLTIWDFAKATKEQYLSLIDVVKWVTKDDVTTEDLQAIRDRIGVYEYSLNGQNKKYAQAMLVSDFQKLPKGTDELQTLEKQQLAACTDNEKLLCINGRGKDYYIVKGAERFGYSESQEYKKTGRYYWTDVVDDLIKLKSARSDGGYQGQAKGTRLIADLASYFRYNSYSTELRSTNKTGVKNTGNIQIQNMIMYAVLVAQSLILFISYIKRLFYVIMLAMLAPIVVVVDFFQKFGK